MGSESAELRRRAEQLRATAQALRSNTLLSVRRFDGPHVWRCREAEQFATDLRRHEATLGLAVDRIEAAAARLSARADQLEQEERAAAATRAAAGAS